MTQQCPPHNWSTTPLKDERDKAIFECSKCGTYITVDCKYLTKAEVQKCAATPAAAD
jgi:transcription elongation factor Elf1